MTVWHDLPDLDTSHLFDGDEPEQEQDEEMPPEAPAAAQDASEDVGRWASTYAIDDAICELLHTHGPMVEFTRAIADQMGCARITVERRANSLRASGILWVWVTTGKKSRRYGCKERAADLCARILQEAVESDGILKQADLSRRFGKLKAGYIMTRLVRMAGVERKGNLYFVNPGDADDYIFEGQRINCAPCAKINCMSCGAEIYDSKWLESRAKGWDQHFIFDEIEPLITCSDGCRDRTINSPQWLKSKRLTSIGAGFYRRLNMNITPDTIVEIVGDDELTAAEIAERLPGDITNKPARIGRNLGMAKKAGKLERSPVKPDAWRKAKQQAAEKKVDTAPETVLDLPESIRQYCSADELRAYRKVKTTALIIAGDVASIRLAAEILSEQK